MSKTKSTKSASAAFIKPDGVSLSVRLFYLRDLTLSVNQLAKFMKGQPFVMSKDEPTQGFTKVNVSGNTVSAEFIASFRLPVYTYEKGKLLKIEAPSFTVNRGTVVVKTDREFVEIRGSDRIAARFISTSFSRRTRPSMTS